MLQREKLFYRGKMACCAFKNSGTSVMSEHNRNRREAIDQMKEALSQMENVKNLSFECSLAYKKPCQGEYASFKHSSEFFPVDATTDPEELYTKFVIESVPFVFAFFELKG